MNKYLFTKLYENCRLVSLDVYINMYSTRWDVNTHVIFFMYTVKYIHVIFSMQTVMESR